MLVSGKSNLKIHNDQTWENWYSVISYIHSSKQKSFYFQVLK